MKDGRHESPFPLALCAILAFPMTTLLVTDDPVTSQHEPMVADQIENRGIRNPDVLRVMRSTPRHLFVPTNVRSMAYEDRPLPIGYRATISQPYIVALMTELLAPAKKHRVLEIGVVAEVTDQISLPGGGRAVMLLGTVRGLLG